MLFSTLVKFPVVSRFPKKALGLVSITALRDSKRIANRRTERPLQRSYLNQIEDRRLFNPALFVDFKNTRGWPVRYRVPPVSSTAAIDRKVHKRSLLGSLPWSVGFLNPSDTLVCVRRKQRKEVLHAYGVAGGRVRPPKWRESSYIQC